MAKQVLKYGDREMHTAGMMVMGWYFDIPYPVLMIDAANNESLLQSMYPYSFACDEIARQCDVELIFGTNDQYRIGNYVDSFVFLWLHSNSPALVAQSKVIELIHSRHLRNSTWLKHHFPRSVERPLVLAEVSRESV
jgi:hypothetical protein